MFIGPVNSALHKSSSEEKTRKKNFFLAFSSSETKMSLFVRRHKRQTVEVEVGRQKDCNYSAYYYCHYKLSPLAEKKK